MDTAILVICIVVAALFLAAVIFKAVLLAKQLKADKAAAEQGEKIGAKHHGKDAYTHALISGPQERMVFRQARFGDTGVSC